VYEVELKVTDAQNDKANARMHVKVIDGGEKFIV